MTGVVLSVPMRVDALLVATDEQVVGSIADFTRLPYSDPLAGGGPLNVNPDVAFIGENVLSEPFEQRNTTLRSGVHLHWALPDALAVGQRRNPADADDTSVVYPVVPTRWLVSRAGAGMPPRRWIVESDYLWPEGTPWVDGRVSFPVAETPNEGPHRQPYRFLGRTWPAEQWREDRRGREHLEQLVAVGYGEPTFAAAYPNCRGVFGLHDAEVDGGSIPDGLRYDVVGWYADADADLLRQHDPDWQTQTDEDGVVTSTSSAELDWFVSGAMATAPGRTVCVGGVDVSPNAFDAVRARDEGVTVAVAGTGTEALSAVMAREVSDEHDEQARIEHQLEALHLADGLRGHGADLAPELLRQRHAKRFHSVPGGTNWTLRQESTDAAARRGAATTTGPPTVGNGDLRLLPVALASELHEINRLQGLVDRAAAEIAAVRRQVFAEWVTYATSRYRPGAVDRDMPRIDAIRAHVEQMVAALNLRVVRLDGLDRLEGSSFRADVDAVAAVGIERLTSSEETPFRAWCDAAVRGDPSDLDALRPALADRLAEVTEHLDRLAAIRDLAGQLSSVPADEGDTVSARDAALRALAEQVVALPVQWAEGLPGGVREALAGVAGAAVDPSVIDALVSRLARLPAITLEPTEAPRFWQSNDPVVLLAGPGLAASDRHGEDGRLRCELLDLGAHDGIWEDSAGAQQVIEATDWATTGRRHTTGDPSHPLYLEWELVVEPREGNATHPDGVYPQDFIEKLTRGTHAHDPRFLRPAPGGGTTPARSYVGGRSVLSPHAGTLLGLRVDAYLADQVAAYISDREGSDSSGETQAELLDLLDAGETRTRFLDWLDRKPGLAHPVHTMLEVRDRLGGLDVQTQALGGFNESLLMQREVLQLHPADPLGDGPDRDFASTTVRRAVLGHNHTSPLPHHDFHPITTGRMAFRSLRLIDTFGRATSLDTGAVVTTVDVRETTPGWLRLPPRITQPARINFRWLSARDGKEEANAHPVASPVCGWFVPNTLDGSLLVYAGDGEPLGYVDAAGRWRPPPGLAGPTVPADIPDGHLALSVEWLVRRARRGTGDGGASGGATEESRFLAGFLDTLDTALEGIDPPNFAEHQARALLTSRPLALVRASIDVEVHGLPAIDQSWGALGGALRGRDFDHGGLVDVRFPLRLGEPRKLDDGVVGYWVETADGYAHDRFVVPHLDPRLAQRHGPRHGPRIDGLAGPDLELAPTIGERPRTVSILLDARGSANCASGVLPAKLLRLPPEHYVDALHHIRVTFLSAPLLTQDQRVEIPVPVLQGWDWSWLQPTPGSWRRVGTAPTVRREAVVSSLPDGFAIWDRLIEKNWISPINDDSARVEPADQRKPLDDPAGRDDDITRLLETSTQVLAVPDMRARFASTSINEGWLSLSPRDQDGDRRSTDPETRRAR